MIYDGQNKYTYNTDGSLASIDTGGNLITYKYDAIGRLVLKHYSDDTYSDTIYLYDVMGRCVKEGSDEYIYGNDFNEIIATYADGFYRYYLADAIGSVICTTSGSSGIYEIRYDAYGNDEPVGFAPVQEFGFAGMRYDRDADIYLTPNRAYSPTLGRWLTPDPLGTTPNTKNGNRFSPAAQYTDGLNLYEYCGNDPVNSRDDWGLVAKPLNPYGGDSWGCSCGGSTNVGCQPVYVNPLTDHASLSQIVHDERGWWNKTEPTIYNVCFAVLPKKCKEGETFVLRSVDRESCTTENPKYVDITHNWFVDLFKKNERYRYVETRCWIDQIHYSCECGKWKKVAQLNWAEWRAVSVLHNLQVQYGDSNIDHFEGFNSSTIKSCYSSDMLE